MRRILFALGLIGSIVATASAATITVCPDGSGDYLTIQEALNVVAGGDSIMLCNAVFTGPGNVDLLVDVDGITIISESEDPDSCIIDCAASPTEPHRAMQIDSVDSSFLLKGITIRNAWVNDHAGAGVYFRNASPVVENCVFENCAGQHPDGGGGCYIQIDSPTFIGCVWRENTAPFGAGVRTYTDNSSQPTDPVFIDCLFESNQASDEGGAVYCGSAGGGGNLSSPTLSGCTFMNNSATESGGAIFHDNPGGGSITIEQCTFTGNSTANHHGGGVYVTDHATVTECLFCANSAEAGGGGLVIQGDNCQVTESVFYGNVAATGGAVFVTEHSTNAQIDLCTLSDNDAPAAAGIRILQPTVVSNTIIAFGVQGAAAVCEGSGSLTLSCSDIYGNAGGPGAAEGQIGSDNNIALDPRFCARGCDELYLCNSSPCAEANNPACGQIGARPVDCMAGVITVVSPNGGEDLGVGESTQIIWDVETSPCNGEFVVIELVREGEVCLEIAADVPLNQGSYEWVAEQCGEEPEGYTVGITDLETGATDESDADFRILPHYRITQCTDIPNDQGRWVRLCWNRAHDDQGGTSYTITRYTVWRRIDLRGDGHTTTPHAQVAPGGLIYPPGEWEFVDELPACGEEYYCKPCPTLCDSTITGGMCWSVFFVRAHTEDPLTFFDTAPDSGYSVDNLVPVAPQDLHWEVTNEILAWEESQEEDFDHFAVYASDAYLFDPANPSLVELANPCIGTSFDVSGCTLDYFHVLAFDHSGNMGVPATLGREPGAVGQGSDKRPTETLLYQNHPNPLTGRTRIRFDLATEADVRLVVFDAGGRAVATLLDRRLAAGSYNVPWTPRDASGVSLASGLYFYRLTAGEDAQTRRMLLTR